MSKTPQENAYAERINRTIKEEYLAYWEIDDFKQLKRMVNKAVKHYNTKRLHNHLNNRTPEKFMKDYYKLKKQNKPVITIFDYQ